LSNLRIDLSPLQGSAAKQPAGGAGLLGPVLRVTGVLVVLAVLPFVVLIRGGVFAYHAWGIGTWPALIIAVLPTALLLGAYAWWVSRRLGAGAGLRKLLTRTATGVGVAYVSYALVFVASANVKSEEVRAEYASMHPLLRVASSVLVLVDCNI
jgi:hypothetical protein